MGPGDIKRNGEAEASSRLIEIAGIVQPHKGPEGIGPLIGWNARSIVIDRQCQLPVADVCRHPNQTGMAHRIAQ